MQVHVIMNGANAIHKCLLKCRVSDCLSVCNLVCVCFAIVCGGGVNLEYTICISPDICSTGSQNYVGHFLFPSILYRPSHSRLDLATSEGMCSTGQRRPQKYLYHFNGVNQDQSYPILLPHLITTKADMTAG